MLSCAGRGALHHVSALSSSPWQAWGMGPGRAGLTPSCPSREPVLPLHGALSAHSTHSSCCVQAGGGAGGAVSDSGESIVGGPHVVSDRGDTALFLSQDNSWALMREGGSPRSCESERRACRRGSGWAAGRGAVHTHSHCSRQGTCSHPVPLLMPGCLRTPTPAGGKSGRGDTAAPLCWRTASGCSLSPLLCGSVGLGGGAVPLVEAALWTKVR